MPGSFLLKCFYCQKTYKPTETVYTCPNCDPPNILACLEVSYKMNQFKALIKKEDFSYNTNFTIWRFLPFLPVKDIRTIQPLKVGCTPLYNARRLAEIYKIKNIYIKDEGRNPTGSLKDRASTVGISMAMEKGYKVISCASTGNLASSVACFASSAGLMANILVPESTPKPKIAQAAIHGANVIVIKGNYTQAIKLCHDLSIKHNSFNMSSLNPYLLEGQKTIAYEICEQLGFDPPDRIFVPVGDGQTVYAIYKGFVEMKEIGFIQRIPQLIGVQSEKVSPIAILFKEGHLHEATNVKTIADSIAVQSPTYAQQAVKAVKKTEGIFVTVDDSDILASMKQLATTTGIFTEPAGGAALAGAIKMKSSGLLDSNERIVIISSGIGLKDIQSALIAADNFNVRSPDDSEIEKIFSITNEGGISNETSTSSY